MRIPGEYAEHPAIAESQPDTSRPGTPVDSAIRAAVDELVRDAPTKLRCVGLRVDWYSVGFRVEVSPAARKVLRRAASDAAGMLDRGGEKASRRKSAPVQLGTFVGELQQRKAKNAFVITNGLVKVDVDLEDPWSVVVELRAMYLAKIPFRDAIEAARAIAREFGAVEGERVRRVDLAADFVGWKIEASDATSLIGRALRTAGNGNVADYRPGVEEFDPSTAKDLDGLASMPSRTYWAGQRVTGVTICAGSPLMCRIYDKSAELSLHGREIKREVEETRWKRSEGGWNGERVTRLEFQLRSEALREFRIGVGTDDERSARNPERLIGWLDEIFTYCTRQWARLVVPETRTRLCRCPVDPRWEFLRTVRFDHVAEPAIRIRTRRGADVAGALGCARSLVASTGLSFPIQVPAILLSNERFAEWFIAGFVEAEYAAAAEVSVRMMLSKCVGPDDKAALAGELVNAKNACVARFATSEHDMRHPVVPAFVRDALYEAEEREALEADRPRRPLTYPELVKLLEDTTRDVGLTFVDINEREADVDKVAAQAASAN